LDFNKGFINRFIETRGVFSLSFFFNPHTLQVGSNMNFD
jgi:hypothetical protein